MWRIVRHSVLGLVGGVGMLVPALADETAAWAALRHGGYMALMRHAEAPGGAGDPPGFRLDACSTQRNLSAKGRADAQAVGQTLRARGVAVAKLLSSPWCRCVDTARLLDLGPVEIEPTFGNAFVLADQRSALTAGAKATIARWQGPETLLIVTHGANIQALTGVDPALGEIVVVAAGSDGAIREIGRIPAARRSGWKLSGNLDER
jgi:phosphohistidine phosphatase SixA